VPSRRADDILAWLLARQPDKRIVEKTTGMPYGWGLWLRALTPLPRPVRASEFIAELIQRPLPGPPGPVPTLSTLQSMRRLLWQTWDPAPRDQRWMRWTSGVISALLHVMFALLLVWVALIRPPVPVEQGGDGGGRMQVRFIGEEGGAAQGSAPLSETTPDSTAGGTAPSGAEPRSTPAPTASRSEAARPTPASTPTASPPPPTPPAPETPEAPVATQPPSPPQPAPLATAPPEPTPPAPSPTEPPPVQATDVAEATTAFVVPPPVVPRTEVRVVPREAPQVEVRERTVTPVEALVVTRVTPPMRPIDVQVPQREMAVREREVTVVTAPMPTVSLPGPPVEVTLPQRDVQVREREVASVPDLDVRVPQVAPREIAAPAPTRSTEVTVRERSIPNAPVRPSPAEASAATTAAATSTSSTTSPSTAVASSSSSAPARAATPSATPAPARGAAATAPAASPAARPAPHPGDWSTPARGDDWGAASRTPGSASQANQGTGRTGDGLFNADGSVRVPGQEGSGTGERGAPGGANDGWSRERIAQSGTWLKRPPYDYTPTSFDKYWAPNESLLAEWVRRGVQAVEIPIPGTSSKISCVISILQFGGGCGLTDPNMQDQPAVARPPPDIPFKKELQDDNGSR
jgi:hypothetical protein